MDAATKLAAARSQPPRQTRRSRDLASTLFTGANNMTDLNDVFLDLAKRGEETGVEKLLQSGHDLQLDIDARDKRTGNTALYLMAKKGNVKGVEILLKHGADATLRNHDGNGCLSVANMGVRKAILDAINDAPMEPRRLLQAAWQGNKAVVEEILKQSPSLLVSRNRDGLTPLLLLCRDLSIFERIEAEMNFYNYDPIGVIQVLLSSSSSSPSTSPPSSPNMNLFCSFLDDENRTVLHYLCLADSVQYGGQILEYLLKNVFNLNDSNQHKEIHVESRDRSYLSPIHCAAQYGHVAILECLLQHGADPNSKGFRGTTPLHITAYNNHEKAAMTLIQYGADVTQINEDGLTPADVAKKGTRLHSTLKRAWLDAKRQPEQKSPHQDDGSPRVISPRRGELPPLTERQNDLNTINGLPGQVSFDDGDEQVNDSDEPKRHNGAKPRDITAIQSTKPSSGTKATKTAKMGPKLAKKLPAVKVDRPTSNRKPLSPAAASTPSRPVSAASAADVSPRVVVTSCLEVDPRLSAASAAGPVIVDMFANFPRPHLQRIETHSAPPKSTSQKPSSAARRKPLRPVSSGRKNSAPAAKTKATNQRLARAGGDGRGPVKADRTPQSSSPKKVPPLDVDRERELDTLIEEIIDDDEDTDNDECGAMADVIERLLGRESRLSQEDEDQEESDPDPDDGADEDKTLVNNEDDAGDKGLEHRPSDELYVSRLAYRDAEDDVEYDSSIRWKKGHCLGKGSFGTVWRALTDTGQLIAVKQLEVPVDDSDFVQTEYGKVEEEVAILRHLKHPNIVEFIGTSFDGSVLHIFMELVPGGSIAANLKQFGAFEEGVMKNYTKQILSGIIYLHDNNVIHRDIKGGNVMLMPSGVVKLIDFGCAKRLVMKLSGSDGDMLKSLRGTPFWMAPEVINETGYGKKSDVWSLGCTVYEMATTKPPWGEMDRFAALLAIGSGSDPVPQLPAMFAPHAYDFVNTCLTRDQSLRPVARQLESHPFLTGDQHGGGGGGGDA